LFKNGFIFLGLYFVTKFDSLVYFGFFLKNGFETSQKKLIDIADIFNQNFHFVVTLELKREVIRVLFFR